MEALLFAHVLQLLQKKLSVRLVPVAAPAPVNYSDPADNIFRTTERGGSVQRRRLQILPAAASS